MPTFLKKKNNAKSKLLNPVTQGDSAIVVRDSGLFPTRGEFMITVWNRNQVPDPSDDPSMEIMKVTSVSGRVFTVTRGQEGTVATTHSQGNAAELLFTVGQLEEYESEIQILSQQITGENHWDRESGSDTLVPFIANSNVNIGSGNMIANSFFGDGSSLTNINGQNIPFSQSGFSATNLNDAVEELLTRENLWDRVGSTLSQHYVNDNLDLGLGNIVTSGDMTCNTLHYTTLDPVIDLSGYVPYTGATTTLNLGSQDFITTDTAFLGLIDLGTNTIDDASFTGDWAFNGGNLSGIGTLSAGATTVTSLSLNDTNTQITEDGSGNMVLKDAVAGSISLVELSCPPLVTCSEATVAEGNNSIVFSPQKDKVLLKWIKVVTTSTDWTLTLYTADDYTTGAMEIVTNRSGDYNIYFDYPWEDSDSTGEIHYNFTTDSGAETHNIEVRGYALR